MRKTVFIHTEYITLGQLLKFENIVESGGFVKEFLESNSIQLNGVDEARRGKKLYPGDVVEIKSIGSFKIATDGN